MPKIRSSPRNKTTPSKTTPPSPSLQTPEMPPKNTSKRKRTTPRSSSAKSDDLSSTIADPYNELQLEDDAKTNSSTSSFTEYQPVGQQLLEQLDKMKKKKHKLELVEGEGGSNSGPNKRTPPPLRVCTNCGTEAKTTRTKKCHSCKQFLLPSLARRYSCEPCRYCFEVPKLSRAGRPSHCSNCNKPLNDEESSQEGEGSLPIKAEEEEEEEEEEEVIKSIVAPPPSLSVGYGSIPEVPSSSPSSSDSPMCLKNEIRRFLKRKILSKKTPPPIKASPLTTPDETPPTDNNNITTTTTASGNNKRGVTLSLSLPGPSQSSSSLNSALESVSSPLLEYAQKISARVMIPPEIPQVQRKNAKQNKKMGGVGGGANKGPSKGNKGTKGKWAERKPIKSDETETCNNINNTDSAIPELIEATPTSRHSAPPIGTCTDTSISYRSSSLTPDSLVVSVATKPHDPTINSIRTLHGYQRPHSLVNTSYSSSSLSHTPSLPPPLIIPHLTSHHHNPVPLAPPPPLFSTHGGGPPPLVSATWTASEQQPSWYNEGYDTIKQTTPTVTHQPVIVDPLINKKPIAMTTLATPPTTTKGELISHETMETAKSALDTNTVATVTDTVAIVTDAMATDTVATDTAVSMATDTITMDTDTATMDTDTVTMDTDAGVVRSDDPVTTEEEVPSKVSKHNKRKQILELQNYDEEEQARLIKKKKKKKKKEKEKERMNDGEYHSTSSNKHHHDKKKKKKSKKKERDSEEECFIERPSKKLNDTGKSINNVCVLLLLYRS